MNRTRLLMELEKVGPGGHALALQILGGREDAADAMQDVLAKLLGKLSYDSGNVVGGEVHEYAKLMAESREQALDRMVEEARSLGANAVVGVRFTTSMMMAAAAELLAVGTAVVVEENSEETS